MHFVYALVFTISGTALLVDPKLGPPGGPRKLRFDVVDSFTAMEYFPFSVAIWDPKDDATLKCVAANRTEIDPVAQTATFVWQFPENEDSPAYEVPFYVTARGPGRVTFTPQDDPTQREGILYYTDRNCIVLDVEFYGHQCILWVVRKFKDSVPQVCIGQFADTCGVAVPEHSRDICFDGEGDY